MNDSGFAYDKIYNTLADLCKKQCYLTNEKEKIKSEYDEKLAGLRNARKNKEEESEERNDILNAYLKIAKAHCTNWVDIGLAEAYDKSLLSRLSVQINNSSKNDKYAEKLYLHASSQLRGVNQELDRIDLWFKQGKSCLDNEYKTQLASIERKNNELNKSIDLYICSDELRAFFDALRVDRKVYEDYDSGFENQNKELLRISIGTKRKELRIPIGYNDIINALSNGAFDEETQTIAIPESIDFQHGLRLLLDYRNEIESDLLNGINNIILNIIKYAGDNNLQIFFSDPVRYNNSSLGVLQPLATGVNSMIDHVPVSQEELNKKLSLIIDQINIDKKKMINGSTYSMPNRLMVFHDFPHGYNTAAISKIMHLFANAEYYNICVIATMNLSVNTLDYDVITYIKSVAKHITCSNSNFLITDTGKETILKWYSLPAALPDAVKKKYIDDKLLLDISNDYEKGIGFDCSCRYKKGVRRLENIPYGINKNGDILTLDFENSNFATFICGASRSGKSTLLHTLITGFIKAKHPDDIEIWLIDFKMTEFSRYIDHMPPHIRYIILDESPELVYDIIDRLTEIMTKRQNVFKGKWQKLEEVPDERYMPAILVIIDEFSVMSQIIVDSLSTSKDNYSVKLQLLLAKGAALGLHFIFASQGFTSGIRGLNDFSKKQIQQRIAMKTEYNEIKETLGLKLVTEADRAMMEQLPTHHALVRTPVDQHGNHIIQSKILFISDYSKQEQLIDSINKELHTSAKYSVKKVNEYIDKKSIIIDGNSYSSFDVHRDEMSEYLNQRRSLVPIEREDVFLFLGEPKRMLPLFPIEIYNGFSENILIVSRINEKMATTSVLMSISESLKLVGKKMEVWANKRNKIYQQLVLGSQPDFGEIEYELGEICARISSIKESIDTKEEGDKYVLILGAETLFMDMSYQGERKEAISRKSLNVRKIKIEKRAPGELDLISLLNIHGSGDSIQTTKEEKFIGKNATDLVNDSNTECPYDARADFKFILTQGPRMGYHFVLVFNSVGELEQSKLDLSLFRHKIVFRLSKQDAVSVIGSSGASAVSEMIGHTFRYTNGLDALSFRPYLHKGLSWDGWIMSTNGISNSGDEEEYLM